MPWWLTYTLTKTVNNKQWLWYTQDHVLNTNTAVIKYELRGQFYVQTSELMYKETVQTHPYHQIYTSGLEEL